MGINFNSLINEGKRVPFFRRLLNTKFLGGNGDVVRTYYGGGGGANGGVIMQGYGAHIYIKYPKNPIIIGHKWVIEKNDFEQKKVQDIFMALMRLNGHFVFYKSNPTNTDISSDLAIFHALICTAINNPINKSIIIASELEKISNALNKKGISPSQLKLDRITFKKRPGVVVETKKLDWYRTIYSYLPLPGSLKPPALSSS